MCLSVFRQHAGASPRDSESASDTTMKFSLTSGRHDDDEKVWVVDVVGNFVFLFS